jgi:S1-C subfamily serine protease
MSDHRNERVVRGALAILVVCLAGLFAYRIFDLLADSWRERAALAPKSMAPPAALQPDERQTVDLFDNAVPSIVYVRTIANTANSWLEEPRIGVVGGASGFVWESNYVVTSFHVVSDVLADRTGRRRLVVQLRDGSLFTAAVVGVDPDSDVAVLKVEIDPRQLKPIPLASSKSIRVGQRAYVIGNPFGREYTLTGGLVSALDREIESMTRRKIPGVIQTDAAVNPGNSGGPLLDSGGRLIGMVAAASIEGQNLGFAIPSDMLNAVVPDLIKHGRVQKAGLGVSFAADQFNQVFRRHVGIPHGMYISRVPEGSAAEKAGMQRNDVLAAVDGQPVDDRDGYYSLLDKRKIGDKVKLTLLRDGNQRQIDFILQERRPF